MEGITYVDVVIVGGGVSGIFAAISLSESDLDVIILDKGKDVSERNCILNCKKHPKVCDVSCGVGGAGLFSDSCLHYSTKIGGNVVHQNVFEHYRKIIDKIYEASGLSQYIGYPDREFLQELKGLNLEYADIEQRVFGEEKVVPLVKYLKSLWNEHIELKTSVEVKEILKIDVTSNFRSGFKIVTDKGIYESRFVIVGTGQWGHSLIVRSCKKLKITMIDVPTSYGFRVETLYDRLKDVTQKFYNWKVYGKKFRTYCVNNRGKIVMHRGEEMRLSTNGSHSNTEPTENTNLAIMSRMSGERMFKIMRSRKPNEPPILQRWTDLIQRKVTTSEDLAKNTVKPTLKRYVLQNLWDLYTEQIMNDFIADMISFGRFSPHMLHDDLLVTGPEWKYEHHTYPTTTAYESKEQPGLFFVGDCNANCYAIVMASMSGYIAGQTIADSKTLKERMEK